MKENMEENAEEYRNKDEKGMKEEQNNAACPWRRYFARMLDLYFYGTLAYCVVMLLSSGRGIRIPTNSALAVNIVSMAPRFFVMLVLEPVLLHTIGTTPGKAAMGLKLRRGNGEQLELGQAFLRTWRVFWKGMGLGLPIVQLLFLLNSWRVLSTWGRLSWDYDLSYTVSDKKGYRWFILAALGAAFWCVRFLCSVWVIFQNYA